MGFVSLTEKSLVEAAGPSFPKFVALSGHHGDGWGIATCESGAHPTLLLEPTRAKESHAFKQAAHNLKADGTLLHFRWATGNLAIKEGNTHPFTEGDLSFIHNGALIPPDSINHLIDPQYLTQRRGETDSESYFFLILTEAKKFGLEAGIRSAIDLIRENSDFSSLNAMLLTPTEFFIINEHNFEKRPKGEPLDYYDLAYLMSGSEILVASSGWDQSGWEVLPNHRLMVVDRTTLYLSISEL
jgi:predicted glutamine amidotransferase